MTPLDQVAWHADERRLYIRRIRELLKGETAFFPNGLSVKRGEFSYLIFEGSKKLDFTEAIGHQANPQKRIEKIVDWMMERNKQMDKSLLSSKSLLVLHELQSRGAMRRGAFDESSLESLYSAEFIRDVHPGKIAITERGQDYLMPPIDGAVDVPPAAVEEVPALPPAADLPAGKRKPRPAANGVLAPKTLLGLIAIARAGGEIKRTDIHHFTVDKLLLEGLIEESGADRIAVTPLGLARLEQDDARQAAAPESATAGNTPPLKKSEAAGIDCHYPGCPGRTDSRLHRLRAPAHPGSAHGGKSARSADGRAHGCARCRLAAAAVTGVRH